MKGGGPLGRRRSFSPAASPPPPIGDRRRQRPHSTPHLSRPYECAAFRPRYLLLKAVVPSQGSCTSMGAGGIPGDKETHDRRVRSPLARRQPWCSLSMLARLRPRYPVAIEQAYTATTWVAEHGASIGVDPSRLAVAGDSVGGNMAAVTTLLAKERGGPQIHFRGSLLPGDGCQSR